MFSSNPSNGKKKFIKLRNSLNNHLQLPDKSIASLVKYYYSWKKARTRSSTERHEKKSKHGMEGGSENGSENGSPNDSDVEEKVI